MEGAVVDDLTELLRAWEKGDSEAFRRLTAAAYHELRRLAHVYLQSERADHTLETRDLVHEVFLRLVDQKRVHWHNRDQFFRLAARLMRRLLVDHARRRQAEKRGGGLSPVPLVEARGAHDSRPMSVLALDRTLESLADRDPQQARIVELRFFVGLSIVETARTLRLSASTVKREWAVAKAWLARELDREDALEA